MHRIKKMRSTQWLASWSRTQSLGLNASIMQGPIFWFIGSYLAGLKTWQGEVQMLTKWNQCLIDYFVGTCWRSQWHCANPRTMITRLFAPLRAFSACTQAGCMLVRIEAKALPQISTWTSPQLSRVAFGQHQARGCLLILLKLKGQIWWVVALHTLQRRLTWRICYNITFVSCKNMQKPKL